VSALTLLDQETKALTEKVFGTAPTITVVAMSKHDESPDTTVWIPSTAVFPAASVTTTVDSDVRMNEADDDYSLTKELFSRAQINGVRLENND
jgi:hypothetical protein